MSSSDLKLRTRGRWRHILMAFGVAESALTGRHAPCPGCGGKDRFRFDDRDGEGTWICSQGGGEPIAGDGFSLLKHAFGWTFREAAGKVEDILGDRSLRLVTHASSDGARRRRRPGISAAQLQTMWDEAIPLVWWPRRQTPLLVRYLRQGRGLEGLCGIPPALRYVQACPYYDDSRRVHTFPAMLAAVRDPLGRLVALHRTYIAPNGYGKAPVASPRKLTPVAYGRSTKGAAIRLYPASAQLIIGEGIETALVGKILRPTWSVWSCLDALRMRLFEPPVAVREILVLADHDDAGRSAAVALRNRLTPRGIDVTILLPPTGPGTDWLDAYVRRAIR